MSNELFAENDISEWETLEDGVTVEAPDDADVTVTVPEGTPTEVTVEPEAPTEDEEPPADDEPEAEPDPAAMREQIQKLEKHLADKDDFNGRLTNELGELRKLQEQMLQEQQRPQVSDWDSLIDADPARAAQMALQAGNTQAYEQAKQSWEEYSPGSPAIYEQGLRLQYQMDQMEKRFQETTAPLQAQQASQQITGVYQAIREQYPDFDQFEGAMAELVEARPLMKATFAKVVQEGSPEEQFAYLEDLHALASGRKADTLREAAKKVAGDHATETLRAKQEAQVASASANLETAQSKTIGDRIGAEWDEIEKPYKDGWLISPA